MRSQCDSQRLGDSLEVLVTPAGEIYQDHVAAGANARFSHAVRDSMARFECRDDSLGAAERLESFQRFFIGDGDVSGPADVVQPGMFRTDTRIVESGRDRVRFDHLTVVVL